MTPRRLMATLGVLLVLGTAPGAAPHLVGVYFTVATSEVVGATAQGQMNVSVVNHATYSLRNVRIALESPSGTLGEQDGVEIGDLGIDATAHAVAPFTLDAAFFESSDPYVVRVTLVDVFDTTVEARQLVARP